MSRRWVVNASPLIALANAKGLSLLPALAADVVIPTGVVSEVAAGEAGEISAGALALVPSARLETIAIAPEVSEWSLRLGESEVLTFARENPGFTAVVDDREARRCASVLGVPEWTSSVHESDPGRRVLRGGSWDDDSARGVRAAYRDLYGAGSRDFSIGFRCARTP